MSLINELQKAVSKFEIETQDCGICSKQNYIRLHNKDRNGLTLEYVVCKNCGLIQTLNKYKIDNYKTFYNNFYTPIYKNYEKMDSDENFFKFKQKGKEIYDLVSKYKQLNSKSKIIEIGCGIGGIISYFHDKGLSTKGIDINLNDINFGKNKGLNLHHQMVEDLPDNEKYDLVILMRSLEHIHNPRFFLNQIIKKLNKNGLLFVSVPSLDSLLHSSGPKKVNIFKQLHFAHVYFFSKQSLSNLMASVGFSDVYMNHYINSIWQKKNLQLNLVTQKQ